MDVLIPITIQRLQIILIYLTMEEINMLITKKIEAVNSTISKEPFFDIEVLKMTGVDLVVAGSKDFSYSHSLEIIFKDVFHMCINSKWSIDTEIPFVRILEGDEAYQYNEKYDVEQGNIIFSLSVEDMETTFYIVAKDIEFNEDNVLYFRKENLEKGERFADWV